MGAIKFLFILVLFVSYAFSNSLKIGILPYTDPLKILSIHQPLKTFLETELNEKVEIYSSSSYEKFFEDTKNGEFDMIITGPHFGLIHLQEGFIPLFRYNTDLQPIFVVLKESPYTKVKDLKNKKISMSNYLSVSSISGIKSLVDEGFKNGVDFKLINATSHTSAIMSVILGDTDAAITTYTPLKQLTDEAMKSKIRFFESGFEMPHLFTIANSKVPAKKIQSLKKALLKFEKTSTGKEFFVKTGYKGYIQITKKDLDAMKPVLDETKSFLKIK
ncbi:MAG: PhnD/SsuA/transferrin family substrate-binding protein [Arcobacteraceae bacterium]|nr:PhnD/SsuA/transferrin family substrate-binding protein [Arcobacteraceae bacterium]